MTELCQYPPNPESRKKVCGKPAVYKIGWEDEGKVKWISVCGTHDYVIGIKNLMATGLSHADAKKLDKRIRLGQDGGFA